MKTASPSSPAVASVPRRRRWPWILGLCLLAPFVVLGLMAANYLTLDRDAAALRHHVMRATGSNWNTKVQLSIGGITLGGLRAGLGFVVNPEIEKARLGLGAVEHASVGVYRRAPGEPSIPSGSLLVETDHAMRGRGWTRVVGVVGKRETVLIYVPAGGDESESIKICVAVIDGLDLVVVSTSVAADALAALLQQAVPADWRDQLHRNLQLASR